MAEIDRARAAQFGLNASTVATNLNVSLSSSEQVSPNFWTDPASGIPYFFAGANTGAESRPDECAFEHAGFQLADEERSAGPGHAQQRRDDQARQGANQLQPDQHPAGL
jgi:hypothetical protein